MGKLPWTKWFAADWMGDPALSKCTPATRGVWMDLLCAMLLGDRTGQISATPDEFSRICRCAVADVLTAKRELASSFTAEVTERNGVVTFGCRRLIREATARKSSADRKKRFDARQRHKGNGDSNGDVTLEKLEARGQKDPPIPPFRGECVGSSAESASAEAVRESDFRSKAKCWLQANRPDLNFKWRSLMELALVLGSVESAASEAEAYPDKADPFAYALATLKNRRRERAAIPAAEQPRKFKTGKTHS